MEMAKFRSNTVTDTVIEIDSKTKDGQQVESIHIDVKTEDRQQIESIVVDGKTDYGQWIKNISSRFHRLHKRPWDVSISRVPTNLLAVKEEAYTPQLVAIGPYHRNKDEFQAMEGIKWRYALQFISRIASPEQNNTESNQLMNGECNTDIGVENNPFDCVLYKWVKILSALETEVRSIYTEEIKLDTNELTEMLLIDGCFMLQLFLQKHESRDGHKCQDALLSNMKMLESIQHDFVLLENQIPYHVLLELFRLIPNPSNLSLEKYVYGFFDNVEAFRRSEFPVSIPPEAWYHLLEVVFHPGFELKPNNMTNRSGFSRSATRLHISGIRFQKSDGFSMADVKFNEKAGILRLPQVVISKSTDTILRNLIALEESNIEKNLVTSYVVLMHTLIQSPKDTSLLERNGIIKRSASFDQDAYDFFTSLRKEVVITNFWHSDLCNKVEGWKEFRWPMVKAFIRIHIDGFIDWIQAWMASFGVLKREYFRNRWSYIVFASTVFVIGITVTQTVYAILPYYH